MTQEVAERHKRQTLVLTVTTSVIITRAGRFRKCSIRLYPVRFTGALLICYVACRLYSFNTTFQWRSQKLCLRGGQTRAVEVPSGVGSGRGVPSQPTRGSGWASWAPPVGSRAKPRPQTHFLHILGQKTLLVERKKFHFQLSSAAWTTDPTIFLSLSSPTGAIVPPTIPLGYATAALTNCEMYYSHIIY